jgi:OOP family OmpA-OmpF porin
MTLGSAASRAAALAMLALTCGRASTTEPVEERVLAHCQRDLPAAQVCTTPSSSDLSGRDSDDDRIDDARDCCPELREDLDGFEDRDGCPDCDNDGDGILDAEWLVDDGRRRRWIGAEGQMGHVSCKDLPEDVDGIDDDDGCPDGVEIPLDSLTCSEALARERRSSAVPRAVLASYPYPLDSDDDAYVDPSDDCPNTPEDFDNFEDEDGCPDCDNDGDGIPDADTWVLMDYGPQWANRDRDGELDCRNDPEDVDGDRDHDGCPE